MVQHILFSGDVRGVGSIPSLAATRSGQLGLVSVDGFLVQLLNLGGRLL